MKNAAGDRPFRTHSQQPENFQNIQVRGGDMVERPFPHCVSSGDFPAHVGTLRHFTGGLAGKVPEQH